MADPHHPHQGKDATAAPSRRASAEPELPKVRAAGEAALLAQRAQPSRANAGERPAGSIGGRIFAIALTTYREATRNRVLLVLVLFVVALLLFSLVLGELSLHEEVRVLKDMGLAGISLACTVIALFLGVNLLSKELDKKTVFAILPKPIERWEFIVGKYAGLAATMSTLLVGMVLLLALLVTLRGGEHGSAMLRAETLVWLEIMLLIAIAVLFSSFSSPYLSAMLTASLWIIGRNTGELEALARTRLAGSAAGNVVHAILWVVPDFRLFFASGVAVADDGEVLSIHDAFIDWSYVGQASGYATLYVAICLIAAALAFSRRDFV